MVQIFVFQCILPPIITFPCPYMAAAAIRHHAGGEPLKMPAEPDLATIVEAGSDRLTIRNIIYAAWCIFNSSGTSSCQAFLRWEVQKICKQQAASIKGGMTMGGYLLLIHFGTGFHISLQEMQVSFSCMAKDLLLLLLRRFCVCTCICVCVFFMRAAAPGRMPSSNRLHLCEGQLQQQGQHPRRRRGQWSCMHTLHLAAGF